MLSTSIVVELASQVLEEAEQYYLQHGKLSDDVLTQLHSIFGNTLTLAAELLENCRITEYRIADESRRIYKIGNNSERYTVYNGVNFCHCDTFRKLVLAERAALTCSHVLAIKLNQITGSVKVQSETVTDSQLVEFLNEQLSQTAE